MKKVRIGLELIWLVVLTSWATQADALGNTIQSMLVATIAGIILAGLFLELTLEKPSASEPS